MEDPATPPKKPVETAYKDTEEAKVVSFAATINEDIHRKVIQKLEMYADRYEEPCMTLQHRTEGHAETRCTEIKCAWGQTVKIMQECVVCRDFIDYQHWFCLPCGDIICQPCIYTLFERAAAKESDHPPQCGGIKINMDWFLKNDLDKTDIGKNLLARFREKIKEYSTIDRTYCAVPTCSAFIEPDPIFPDKFALCTSCQSRTCIKCKHLQDSPECCVSTDFHETAKSMKWRKCQHCNTWIERDDGGCNRMICTVCHFHFCYNCGLDWKKCQCLKEDRLDDQSDQVAQVNDQGNQLGGRALAPEEAASESEDRERSLLDSNPPPTVNQYTSLAPQIAPTCRERRAERLRRLRQSQQRGEESEILPARFPLLTFHPMTVDAPPVATITITPPPELAEAIDSENMSTSNVEENVRDTQGDHGDSHPNEEENVGSRTDGTGDSGRHHGDDRGGLMDHRGEEDKDHEKHHPKGDDKDGLKSDDKDEKNDHLNSQFKVKKIDMLRHQRIHHARVEPHHHGKTGSHKLKGRVLSNHRNKPVYGHKDDSDSDSPHLFKDEYEFEPYRRPGNDFIEPADLSLGYHSHRTLKDELRGAWDDSSDEDDEGNGDTNGNQNRTKQLIKTSIFTAAAYVRKVLAYSACKITVFLCRLVYCILCVLIALVIWALFVLALYLVVSGGNIELLLSQ